jgi:ATP-dependent Lhr-like helicase
MRRVRDSSRATSRSSSSQSGWCRPARTCWSSASSTLALRKRFCRTFNQELQAAATDDAIVLSLGNPQTFPLESFPRFLSVKTVEDVLTQALLASPMFTARWRWNATRALSVLRTRGSGPVPFPLQRMQADDLLAAVFPDQAACQENITGAIEVPDHPLVRQTLHDSLHEACDLEGLERLLVRIESGEVRMHVRDTVAASPFAHEILNSKPYSFLDDAPLEERRTRAVALRHVLPESARDLGRLEPAAIARVREEAMPPVRDADELYELLADLVVLRREQLPDAGGLLAELVREGRATRARLADGRELAVAAERLPVVETLLPEAALEARLELPQSIVGEPVERERAVDLAVRGHLEILGPTTAAELAERVCLSHGEVAASLARLETRGVAVRGRFDPELEGEQLCDRSLLARIHRYTIADLRRAIEPVSAEALYRFLIRWQHLDPETRLAGEGGAREAIAQLAGFEAAAGAWESELLAARVEGYRPELLDRLCLGGEVAWGRLTPGDLEPRARPSRSTPIALFPREELDDLLHAARSADGEARPLSGPARRVLELLRERGALFAREIEARAGLLPVQVEEGLRELVARGLVSCDGFAPLRRLLAGRSSAPRRRPTRGRVTPRGVPAPEGRWGLLEPLAEPTEPDARAERSADRLLRRYGVVFRDLLAREWLPDGWRAVHRALRRLEARGRVRGGRFVSGFIGEQFALPDAVPLLRAERTREPNGSEVRVSAADPLNLVGLLTPGPRLPASHTRSLVLRDGLPVAVVERGQRRELSELPGEMRSAEVVD